MENGRRRKGGRGKELDERSERKGKWREREREEKWRVRGERERRTSWRRLFWLTFSSISSKSDVT